MALPFKIHTLLSREELDQLEAFAREPGRTVDDCHEWMQAHGYRINRSSVGTWKQHFNLCDRFGAANASAKALMEAAKEGGTVAISDAAALNLMQMIWQKMIELQESGEVETKELWALSMALGNVIKGKRHVEKLRGEVKEALDAAAKDARKGASGEAVMGKVRELLGISEPPDFVEPEVEPKLLTVPPEGRVVEDQP